MPKPAIAGAGSDAVAVTGSTKKTMVRSRTRRNRAERESKTPRIARKDALKHMLPAGPTPPTAGVVYVGHLPRGFYEDEIRDFFSQFGEVTRVRVARSKKTGGVKGYAFVEFSNSEVRLQLTRPPLVVARQGLFWASCHVTDVRLMMLNCARLWVTLVLDCACCAGCTHCG